MNFEIKLVGMWFFFAATMVIYWSFLEWWVHKEPMHNRKFKKILILGLLYESHVGKKSHHSRHGYCSSHPECHDDDHEHEPILQKFWFGFLVAGAGCLPFVLLESSTTFKYNFSILCFIGIYVYYWLFELIHVASHDGKHWQRILMEHFWYFNTSLLPHHMIHHTNKLNMNFTLVNHWCDYVFGTKYGADLDVIYFFRIITFIVLTGFLALFFMVV